jgi:TetR/AcrR family transcriptional repressor of nem operon
MRTRRGRHVYRLSHVTDSTSQARGARGTAAGDKRTRLVAAARATFHEHGVEQTTLAMVAAAADFPVGNLYYYFKTKDELLSAVIGAYDADYAMLDALLSKHRTPKGRLRAFVRILTSAKERISAHGCPIGSLCSELDKRNDEIAGEAATVLGKLIAIAELEFRQFRSRDSRELAVALIAAYEGAALLANTLRDPGLLEGEARRLERWIDSL